MSAAFAIALAGGTVAAELRLPPLGDVVSLWMAPEVRTPDRTAILQRAEVRRFLASVDGQPVSSELAVALARDHGALAQYRAARDRALAAATEGGLLFARCPHCREWEADLIPLAVAVLLRAPFYPVRGGDGSMAVPALAARCDEPVASAVPFASTLSFVLPRHTTLAQFPRGVFAARDDEERTARYRSEAEALANSGAEVASDWQPRSPGLEAIARLGAMIERWPEPETLTSIDRIAAIALEDFLWIDNVYYLTRCVQPSSESPPVMCERCGGPFLPIGAR